MGVSGYRWDGADLILNVRVQPRASRDEWLAPRDDRIGVRIVAPPVDGKANAELIELVARTFGCTKSSVTVKSGAGTRYKRVQFPD